MSSVSGVLLDQLGHVESARWHDDWSHCPRHGSNTTGPSELRGNPGENVWPGANVWPERSRR